METEDSRDKIDSLISKYKLYKTVEKQLYTMSISIYENIDKTKSTAAIKDLSSVLSKLIREHLSVGKKQATVMEDIYRTSLSDLYTKEEVLEIYNDLTAYRQDILDDIDEMSKISHWMKNKDTDWPKTI